MWSRASWRCESRALSLIRLGAGARSARRGVREHPNVRGCGSERLVRFKLGSAAGETRRAGCVQAVRARQRPENGSGPKRSGRARRTAETCRGSCLEPVGDRAGPTGSPYAARRRFVEEVVRQQRDRERRVTYSSPLPIYTAQRGLLQAPVMPHNRPPQARTSGNGRAKCMCC